MIAEQIAWRYATVRDGYELVDFAEVGLPVFRLTVEAITSAPRRVPTVHIFTMKAIRIGLQTAAEISLLLGVGEEIVNASIDWLLQADCVMLSQSGPPRLELSQRGKETLAAEDMIRVQEEDLLIDICGVRRKPIWLGNEQLLRGSSLRAVGAIEIRPYRVSGPVLSDIDLVEVRRIYGKYRFSGGERYGREILELKRIARTHTLFRSGVGLLYRGRQRHDLQLAFVIDGSEDKEYELEFVANGGFEKMEVANWGRTTDRDRALNQMINRAGVDSPPLKEEVEGRLVSIARLVEEARMAEERVARARPSEREAARAEQTKVRDRLELERNEIGRLPIRYFAPYEQRELLRAAVAFAQRELLITSAWIDGYIVNAEFLRALQRLIFRGVKVSISCSFIPPSDWMSSQTSSVRFGAAIELVEMAATSKGAFQFSYGRGLSGAGGLFYLFSDDGLGAVSTKPFLSAFGRSPRMVCHKGILVQRKEDVACFRELSQLDQRLTRSS